MKYKLFFYTTITICLFSTQVIQICLTGYNQVIALIVSQTTSEKSLKLQGFVKRINSTMLAWQCVKRLSILILAVSPLEL